MSVEAMSWAFQLEGLSSTQKITLLALSDHASKDEWACWPSVETLMKKTALSRRGVQVALRQLGAIGLLTRHDRYAEGRQVTAIYKLRVGCTVCAPGGAPHAPSPAHHVHPEPSITNHHEEPSVPPMPSAPAGPGEPTVKVSDVIAKQKAKSEASSTLSPKAMAAAYHAMAEASKKGLTSDVLSKLWKDAHGAYVDAFLPALTLKERGMLSAAKKRVGPIIVDALAHALADWPAFIARAKESGGAYKTPTTPRVWFFVKYVEDAIALLQAAEKTEQVVGKPVQLIAKPIPLTNPKPKLTLAAGPLSADALSAALDEVENEDG